jgi:hypothetical protein
MRVRAPYATVIPRQHSAELLQVRYGAVHREVVHGDAATAAATTRNKGICAPPLRGTVRNV